MALTATPIVHNFSLMYSPASAPACWLRSVYFPPSFNLFPMLNLEFITLMALNACHCCIWKTMSLSNLISFFSAFIFSLSGILFSTLSCFWYFVHTVTLASPTSDSSIHFSVLYSHVYIFKKCFWVSITFYICYLLGHCAFPKKAFFPQYFSALWVFPAITFCLVIARRHLKARALLYLLLSGSNSLMVIVTNATWVLTTCQHL